MAEVQIMQMGIAEDEIGVVNSSEKALTNVALMVVFLLGIILDDPKYFSYLMVMSLFTVGSAALLYAIWVFFKFCRGKFPPPPLPPLTAETMASPETA